MNCNMIAKLIWYLYVQCILKMALKRETPSGDENMQQLMQLIEGPVALNWRILEQPS